MKNFSRENTLIVLSLIILIISIIIFAFVFRSYTSLKGDIETLDHEVSQSKASYNEFIKIKDNLKSTLANEDRLSSLFVNGDQVVEFIQVIENIMNISGVKGTVDNVSESSGKDQSDNNIKELHLTLSVFGDWNSVLKFQGLVERIPYKATVDSVVMQYSSGDKSVVGWKETLNLTVLEIVGLQSDQIK